MSNPHTRPPTMFLVGGFLLSANGGFINVIAMYEPFHQGVSHLTGTLSRLGMDLAQQQGFIWQGLGLVGSYFMGALLSGALLESTAFKVGRRYGVILMLQGLMMAIAALFMEHQSLTGLFLAAMACGLQNAMATHFSGAVVRTTHMTGIVTDLGIFFGKWISRKPVDWWRLSLYTTLLIGFVLGGFFGALAFQGFKQEAFWASSIFCGSLGIGYWIYRQWIWLHRKPATS